MSKFTFDHGATKLSLLNAFWLAQACDLAYHPLDQALNEIQAGWGFSRAKSFDLQDTQAFVAGNDAMIILAFRGSTSTEDWKTDFNAKLVQCESGRAHCGFTNAINCIWGDLSDTVASWKGPAETLWITGHSLGGALAILAAERLSTQGVEIQGVYTYGQPRVGDSQFARDFDLRMKNKTYRFVHDEDVVPRAPSPLQGYCHIGTECYLDREGKLYMENIWWHRILSRSTSVAIRSSKDASQARGDNPGGLRDHSLSYYIRFIRENLAKTTTEPKDFLDYVNQ